MLQFIVTDALFFSVGVILFLAIRTIPRIGEEEGKKRGYLERLILSDIPERVDGAINLFLVKFLRRFKVVLLKMENATTRKLHRMKADEDAKPSLDFAEIAKDSALTKGASEGEEGK